MDLTFIAQCFGEDTYKTCLPIFAYSAFRAYPGCKVKFFVDELDDKNIRRDLKLLQLDNDLKIDTAFINRFGKCNKSQASRWMIPCELIPTKYAIIMDCDIFVMPETPDVITFHNNRIARLGLPFSNVIRKGQKRLSGIHFIETEPYWFFVKHALTGKDQRELEKLHASPEDNEKLLYNLAEWAFGGMGFPQKYLAEKNRPWHGLHMGAWRVSEFAEGAYKAHAPVSYAQAKKYLHECVCDKMFRQLSTPKKCGMFLEMIKFFGRIA